MNKTSSNSEELITLLERMIDFRYEYLKEKDMENHRYAYRILQDNYRPVVEKLLEVLEKRD